MKTIHISEHFYSCIKTLVAIVLGGLWALGWAWHTDESNLRSYCFRDDSVHTDRQTWLDRLG